MIPGAAITIAMKADTVKNAFRLSLVSGFLWMSGCSTTAPARAADPAAANSGAANPAAATAPAAVGLQTSGVRTIELPYVFTPVPPGPNAATYQSACMLCHSQRYVVIQPPLSRKTWTAEVTKMQKTYGAPITDQQIEPLVDYLVAIRGNGK